MIGRRGCYPRIYSVWDLLCARRRGGKPRQPNICGKTDTSTSSGDGFGAPSCGQTGGLPTLRACPPGFTICTYCRPSFDFSFMPIQMVLFVFEKLSSHPLLPDPVPVLKLIVPIHSIPILSWSCVFGKEISPHTAARSSSNSTAHPSHPSHSNRELHYIRLCCTALHCTILYCAVYSRTQHHSALGVWLGKWTRLSQRRRGHTSNLIYQRKRDAKLSDGPRSQGDLRPLDLPRFHNDFRPSDRLVVEKGRSWGLTPSDRMRPHSDLRLSDRHTIWRETVRQSGRLGVGGGRSGGLGSHSNPRPSDRPGSLKAPRQSNRLILPGELLTPRSQTIPMILGTALPMKPMPIGRRKRNARLSFRCTLRRQTCSEKSRPASMQLLLMLRRTARKRHPLVLSRPHPFLRHRPAERSRPLALLR